MVGVEGGGRETGNGRFSPLAFLPYGDCNQIMCKKFLREFPILLLSVVYQVSLKASAVTKPVILSPNFATRSTKECYPFKNPRHLLVKSL